MESIKRTRVDVLVVIESHKKELGWKSVELEVSGIPSLR